MDSYKDFNNKKEVKHIPINELRKLVKSLINDIDNHQDKQLIKNKKFAELRGKYGSKYSDFILTYPALFNMIIENGSSFDIKQLNTMLTTVSKVRNKEVSNEDASKKFGEEMADKYVNPIIKNLDKNTDKDADKEN